MAWRKNDPSLGNDPTYLEPRITELENRYFFNGDYNDLFNKPETPSTKAEFDAHKLVIASPTVLGHVKVGTNLNVTADGTLNASGGTVSDASTTQKGIVQLNDSIISTSTTQAATPNAVRQLYDGKANKIQESKINITPLNGWITSVSGTYYKDEFGVVHIWAVLLNGTMTSGTALFTVPVGYRPAVATFGLPTYSTDTNGRIVPAYFNNGTLTLNGTSLSSIAISISYRV